VSRTNPLVLVLLGFVGLVIGWVLLDGTRAAGGLVPVQPWLGGLALAVFAVLLLRSGLPIRAYMTESEERRLHPTLAPRRHDLDLIRAYRTIVLARAAAHVASALTGFYLANTLWFLPPLLRGGPAGPVLSGGACLLGAVALLVVALLVETWGSLPPDEGETVDESPDPFTTHD
jgi:hypothetical protein